LPVVAAIPVITTRAERQALRRRRFATSVGTAVVLVGALTFLFVRYGL
jgi:hypothetical protein